MLDNCLSTLKHETMYYPSRISQLIEQNDVDSLSEVVGYYRELYGILSQQAMHQIEGVHMHVRPLENGILGDENLIRYLFEILRKEGGGKEKVRQCAAEPAPRQDPAAAERLGAAHDAHRGHHIGGPPPTQRQAEWQQEEAGHLRFFNYTTCFQ